MKNLLLVEDDKSLGATLQERLERESYKVQWVQSLLDAQRAVERAHFDLVILDIGLPDGSGFQLARQIRESQKTPFLFMTAMNTAENRLEGYEIGAEEFIPKPFHLKELLLRIKHVLQTHSALSRIAVEGMIIDLDAMTIAKSNGDLVRPAARDFQLLKFLITQAPRAVSRDEILNAVWGEDKFPSNRTVDNAVVRLRQDLGDSQGERIRAVRGVGYQWVAGGHRE